MEIPKKYQDLVGTKQFFSGGLFSGKRAETEEQYEVLDIRISDATIVDLKTKKPKHPAFELKIKKPGMKNARWTRPFPIREIKLSGKWS